MPTNTTRLNLYKSDSDGSGFVDIVLDLLNNWDKLDAAIGAIAVASFPVAPFDGMIVNKASDGVYFYDLATTSWVQLASSIQEFKTNLILQATKRLGLGTNAPASPIDIRNAAIGALIQGRVTGDANPRTNLTTSALSFGPGNTATDISLTRPSASLLNINGALTVDTSLSTGSNTSVGGDLSVTGNLYMTGQLMSNLTVNGNLSVTGIGGVTSAFKTANQIVNNSVTLVNDTHLVVNVVANATYIVQGFINYNSPTAADFKWNWTYPASTTFSYYFPGPGTAATAPETAPLMTSTSTATGARGGTGGSIGVPVAGLLITSGTAGQFRFQWAQNTATVGDSTVYAGSFIQLFRVA